MAVDLFGKELSPAPKNAAKGNAAPIGSANNDKTCGDCAHATGWKTPSGRIYYKCDLVKKTRSINTDIRLKWPACSRFKDQKETTDE